MKILLHPSVSMLTLGRQCSCLEQVAARTVAVLVIVL